MNVTVIEWAAVWSYSVEYFLREPGARQQTPAVNTDSNIGAAAKYFIAVRR
jgi:hypothetical protein